MPVRAPRVPPVFACLLGLLCLALPASGQASFWNWESPHIHPLELTPDGVLLLAVNTADAQLQVFATGGGTLTPVGAVAVGIDPVSVRARNSSQAWVVNQLSDSVSVVDLNTLRVLASLSTQDEPADVIFAGQPQRAFVTCSQANSVMVFDPANLSLPPVVLDLPVEEPRALAVSPDGQTVYAAVFESGNGSTALGGGSTMAGGFPPNAASSPAGPHGGQNPAPNDGTSFEPPMSGSLPAPPKVALIVKKDGTGLWRDDTGADWTALVSGPFSALSGRTTGWDLPDRDVVVIDANSLSVSYETQLMNIGMALAVNPVSGTLALVGTDGTNEVRFEPNLTGVFLRVLLALVDPSGPSQSVVDLNAQLDYSVGSVPLAVREQGLGDPRGIAFEDDGQRAWITGMGSDNLVLVDGSGARTGQAPSVEVGQGPTGVVVHDGANRVYVLNKHGASISVVDLAGEVELVRVPFHDATPPALNEGRRHLYDTHGSSGTGIVACGSCHVDGRMDRLAWDLGDPSGAMKSLSGLNLAANIPGLNSGFQPFHPMKGPMTTQTLQDIIGKEPLHWRGDRLGLEEFNPAFVGLQGRPSELSAQQMQDFEDFLATLRYPPNPYRNLDNSLPTNVPLTGHKTPGKFGPAGQPMPDGDAVRGLFLYRPPNLLDAQAVACVTCHTLPTGAGPDMTLVGLNLQPIAPGPNGERHLALVSMDGSTNVSLKIPHMRNLYEKLGMDLHGSESQAGFGFVHDGSVDSLERFLTAPIFSVASLQDLADLVAFSLAFSGSDLPAGSTNVLALEPPGVASLDTHAAVGRQTTLVNAASPAPGQLALIGTLLTLADSGKVELVVKGRVGGEARGYLYLGGGNFQPDRAAEPMLAAAALQALAAPGSELTYTVVPVGTASRYGIDRDEDSHLDRDELDAGSDPADADSVPGTVPVHLASIEVTFETKTVVSSGVPGVQAMALRQRAIAAVTVHDGSAAPVAGATVSAAWSGSFTGAVSGDTDAAGQVTFTSAWVPLRAACFTLSVDGLSGDDLIWDTAADVETVDSGGTNCP